MTFVTPDAVYNFNSGKNIFSLNKYEKYSFVIDTPVLCGITWKSTIKEPLYIFLIMICSGKILTLSSLFKILETSFLKLFSNIIRLLEPSNPVVS